MQGDGHLSWQCRGQLDSTLGRWWHWNYQVTSFQISSKYSEFTFFFSRYYIEALDRTLGGDWFQVGEAAPGDRKVTFCKMPNKFNQTSVVIKVLLFRWKLSLWSTNTDTDSVWELSIRSEDQILAKCWEMTSSSRILGVSKNISAFLHTKIHFTQILNCQTNLNWRSCRLTRSLLLNVKPEVVQFNSLS